MNVGCAGEANPPAAAASVHPRAEEAKIRASPDAVVLPPNEKIARTRDAIRASVAGLLGLPGVSLAWTPAKVEVAASGELACLYAAYTFSARDPSGKAISDTGKNVEIWKKQTDGQWKCIVDTWNSDLPAAP